MKAEFTLLTTALFLLLFQSFQLPGQDRVTLSLYNNSTLLPPGSFYAIANQPIHPGISIGAEDQIKDKKLFYAARFGAYYQQLAHAGIQLYCELGRRGSIVEKWSWDVRFAAGYLHQFSLNESAELINGAYEVKKNYGRPQAMFGPAFTLLWELPVESGGWEVFIQYQVWMQAPYVPGYVPLLPNGSLHLGLSRSLNKTGI